MNKLKKRALGVIAEHLIVEQVAGIKEAFQLMDTNNKGKVSLDQLRNGIQKLGQQIPDPDLQILMEAIRNEELRTAKAGAGQQNEEIETIKARAAQQKEEIEAMKARAAQQNEELEALKMVKQVHVANYH